MYNFDKLTNRGVTNSEKWNKNLLKEHFGKDDILPFWVADMDFEESKQIKNTLSKHLETSILGYDRKSSLLVDSIISWHKKKFDWIIEKNSLRFTPSILNSLAVLINIFSEKEDGVIIQPPVFFQFKQVIKKNSRKIVTNPLKLINGKYEIDFEDLEKKVSDKKNKILILCNPHNPVGRVWKKEELEKIKQLTTRHNVLVISDEIHNGIVFKDYKYTPYSLIDNNSFALISPAKTFNIPGASDSIVIVNNENLRVEFDNFIDRFSIQKTNILNLLAMQEAYSSSDKWLEEVLEYIEQNLEFLKAYITNHIPKVKVINPEGTFLVWLDFRELNMDVNELKDFLAHKAKLALNAGHWFGREGAGFARMTIATQRVLLTAALKNLEDAINKRFK